LCTSFSYRKAGCLTVPYRDKKVVQAIFVRFRAPLHRSPPWQVDHVFRGHTGNDSVNTLLSSLVDQKSSSESRSPSLSASGEEQWENFLATDAR
jgi:hypothetical protein